MPNRKITLNTVLATAILWLSFSGSLIAAGNNTLVNQSPLFRKLNTYERLCHPGLAHEDIADNYLDQNTMDHCYDGLATQRATTRIFRSKMNVFRDLGMDTSYLDPDYSLTLFRQDAVDITVTPQSRTAIADLIETAGYLLTNYQLTIYVNKGNVPLAHVDAQYLKPGKTLTLNISAYDDDDIEDLLQTELDKAADVAYQRSHYLPFLVSSEQAELDTAAKEQEFIRIIRLIALVHPFQESVENIKRTTFFRNRLRSALELPHVHTGYYPEVLNYSKAVLRHFLHDTAIRDLGAPGHASRYLSAYLQNKEKMLEQPKK